MNGPKRRDGAGFTLVELLVAIAMIGLLVSILAPSLMHARVLARMAKAHAELRGITTALNLYREGSAGELPPTRFSCSSRTAYELPVELSAAGLLPGGRVNGVEAAEMPDAFQPGQSYQIGRAHV